ncbi:MAG: hypothetical protein CMK07_11900 [Ponticaulis sp.]|nr:hypothetical protein [Ponticaulis sp.]
MGTNYYTADSIGPGTRITPVSGDTYVILNNITVGSTSGFGVYGAGNGELDFVIYGNLFGDNDGIFLSSDSISANFDIAVGSNGSIVGVNDGIEISGDFETSNGFASIQNAGLIQALQDDAIVADYFGSFDLVNTGEIRSVSSSYGSFAIFANSANISIENSGLIASSNELGALHAGTLYWSPGLGGNFRLNNSGTISNLRSDGVAVVTTARADDITNSGTINGDVLLGYVEESGDYAGDDDSFVNTGEVFGSVFMGGGDDVFAGETGRASGPIHGGAGDDVIRSGLLNDILVGGEGADELWGGAGSDMASYEDSAEGVRVSLKAGRGWFGDAQGDTLHEIENLYGSARQDTLIGNEVNNTFFGGNADDILNGLGGNDQLFGDNGDDNIMGGEGDDFIAGGRHRDRLTGGDGEDVFFYLDILDSKPSNLERDNITDFTPGEDKIDLSQLGDLNFGGSAFTGTAGEIIHYHVAGGTRTVVEIDVDGDSVADFGILLSNAAHAMTAADFLFE